MSDETNWSPERKKLAAEIRAHFSRKPMQKAYAKTYRDRIYQYESRHKYVDIDEGDVVTPKMSLIDATEILRKDNSSPLWNKTFSKWTEKEWTDLYKIQEYESRN